MKDSPLTKIFTEFEEETMISNEIKERLLQKDWYVECKTKKDTDLVLQACDDAEITWLFGDKATECKPCDYYPVDIGFCKEDEGLTHSATYYKKSEIENITDWFFNAIKNNDSKLIPQNEEQEHLVQILLAMMQGLYVEVDYGSGWKKAQVLFHERDYKYRIAPQPTPLITREMWAMIAPKWKWAAMDGDGEVYFYTDEPCISTRDWMWTRGGGDCCNSVLAINTDSINWETSLTERPEDV